MEKERYKIIFKRIYQPFQFDINEIHGYWLLKKTSFPTGALRCDIYIYNKF